MLDGAPLQTVLTVRWYLVQAQGYRPESRLDVEELVTGGTRNVDFALERQGETWPAGVYCVEVLVDDTLAASRWFEIEGSGQGTRDPGNPVARLVLTDEVDPETIQPIREMTSFSADARAIHAAVFIEDAAEGTLFQARWYVPREPSILAGLNTSGTRWIDFRLTPSAQSFPRGEYRVEIYVNRLLVQTATFEVK
jgi:hypothetical protein